MRIAAAIAGLAIATGAVAASQATAASSNTTIYACKAKKGGAVRVVTAKAKCGKTATKISWNTAGPTAQSIVGLTQNAGVSLQPGAGWTTLGTVTFTASSAFRYQTSVFTERAVMPCPGSTPTGGTNMAVAFRFLVNGVVIPDDVNEDGTTEMGGASQVGMLHSWTGPTTLSVIARATTNSLGTPVVPACAITTGIVQIAAFAYTM